TAALSQTFSGLAQGIAEYKRAVTRYPGSLTLLTTAPVSASLDICGAQILTLNALWRGPYATRIIPSTGVEIGDGMVQAGVRRVTAGTNIFYLIDVTGV